MHMELRLHIEPALLICHKCFLQPVLPCKGAIPFPGSAPGERLQGEGPVEAIAGDASREATAGVYGTIREEGGGYCGG